MRLKDAGTHVFQLQVLAVGRQTQVKHIQQTNSTVKMRQFVFQLENTTSLKRQRDIWK